MKSKIIGILTLLSLSSAMAASTPKYYKCKGEGKFAPKMTISTWAHLMKASSVPVANYTYSKVVDGRPSVHFDVQTAYPENITISNDGSIEIRSALTNDFLLSMNSDLSENRIFDAESGAIVPATCSSSERAL